MDRISEKLKIFKEQQAGLSLLKEKILKNPALPLALALACGIIISNFLKLSPLLWLGIASAILLLLIALYLKAGFEKYRFGLFIFISLVIFFTLGGVRHQVYKTFGADHINSLAPDKKMLATIRGTVISTPRRSNYDNWEMAKFKYNDPGSSFYLKLTEMETKQGFKKVSGKIRVSVSKPVLDIKIGDSIKAYCWLDRIKSTTNPGQFNFQKYAANKNIEVSAYIRTRTAMEKIETKTTGFTVFKNKLTSLASSLLISDHDFQSENSSLLQALIIGKRDKIDFLITKAFRQTGLLHLISLSGLHLGILVSFVWIILIPTGISKKYQAAICIVVTILFLMIVPPRAPTVRAGTIAIFFCLANIFSRTPSSLNALSLSALAMILAKPTEIFSPGFQLSYSCVAGILFFTQRIVNFIFIRTPFLNDEKARRTLLRKMFYWFISLTATGLGAWLGGAGILLYHFYTINPLTVLWTAITFPLVAAVLVLGFTKLMITAVFPTVAMLMSFVIEYLIIALIFVVRFISEIFPGQILIGAVPLILIIIYYIMMLASSNHWMVKPKPRKTLITTFCVITICWLGLIKYQRVHPKDLTISVLNVGAGQSVVVRSPSGNFIFDAGSSSTSDTGNRIINPYLRHAGINKTDTIFLSHRHFDHYNAAPDIIKDNTTEHIATNKGFVFEMENSAPAKYLAKWLEKNNKKLQILDKGIIKEHPKITMLWPTDEIAHNKSLDQNDKSQVNLMEFANIKILLCADIEKDSQAKLLELYPDLKADIVVLPHHGIGKTLSKDFLKKVEPEIIISSCSKQQYKRHNENIPEDVINFSTAKNGCIEITITPTGNIKF